MAAVTDGPPWCHCHACGARCWTGPACTLCPGCDQPRWSSTSQAARFAGELGRHGIIHLPPNAHERGQTMCGYGLNPTSAAQVVLDLYRR